MKFILSFFLLLATLLLSSTKAREVTYTKEGSITLHKQSLYFIDSVQSNIDEIEKKVFEENYTKDIYNTDFPIWIKWTVNNEVQNDNFILTIDQWESANLYFKNKLGHWQSLESGTLIPNDLRPESLHRLLTFPIQQDSGLSRTYYLKVQNLRPLIKFYAQRYDFLAKTEWDIAKNVRSKMIYDQVTIFFVLGICFILILYNLILFFNNPRWDLYFLVLYIIVITLFLSNIHGITTNYLLTKWSAYELPLGLLLSHVSTITLFLFIYTYIKPSFKSANSIILLVYIAYTIISLILCFVYDQSLWYTFRRYFEIGCLAIVFSNCIFKKQEGIYYLISAVLVVIIGLNLTEILSNKIGILLQGDIPYLSSILIQLILFTWGSTYTVRRLEKKIKISLKENEKLLSEQNENLNNTVEIKTKELQKLSNKLISGNLKLKKQKKELKNSFTELKNAQEQLVISEKMASLGILSAGIGHEINNPLNFIKGGVDALKIKINESENLDDVRKSLPQLIEIIDTGVYRVTKIVKSLSHFSRNTEQIAEKCNIHEILDNCLIMLSSQLKNKVTVIKNYCEDDVSLLGNEGKLHQAFLNLLANAEQAIIIIGNITISTSIKRKKIIVTITDTGMGIAKENLTRIGDHFFTTKSPGKGTGLGLSITYRIIEEHHGTIQCKSKVKKGTEFTITLPKQSKIKETT